MIVVVMMFGSMAMRMFVTMTMPMTMFDAVGMNVIMFMVLTMLMIVAVIVLAVAMTMARAIGMHMIVGIAAHGDFLAGLKIEDCRPGLVHIRNVHTSGDLLFEFHALDVQLFALQSLELT